MALFPAYVKGVEGGNERYLQDCNLRTVFTENPPKLMSNMFHFFDHVTSPAQFWKKYIDSKFPPVSDQLLNQFYIYRKSTGRRRLYLEKGGNQREWSLWNGTLRDENENKRYFKRLTYIVSQCKSNEWYWVTKGPLQLGSMSFKETSCPSFNRRAVSLLASLSKSKGGAEGALFLRPIPFLLFWLLSCCFRNKCWRKQSWFSICSHASSTLREYPCF